MEDVIVWLIWGAILIGGAVSSARKSKRKRAEAEARRKTAAPKDEGGETVHKSLSQVLRELKDNENSSQTQSGPTYYYEEEIANLEEQQAAMASLEAVTYKEQNATPSARPPAGVESVLSSTLVSDDYSEDNDFAADFDLKRAVIESEILKPKYEQF